MTLIASPSQTSNHKQEKILQGAMQVFFRDGYAGTSMDRVAIEAGVSKQTIYSYFHDKEGLFKALIEQITISRFQTLFDSEELTGDPEGLLRQVAEAYLLKVSDDHQYLSLLRVVIAESSRFPEMAKLYYHTVIQRGRQLLGKYFDDRPELGIQDSEATAQIFFGTLVSFVVSQELMYGKEIMPLSSQKLVDSLVYLILRNKSI
ncbi:MULTISPECIES: TetR/AcrR family transcriptional regulator [Pseudanabaena]|uniref:Transcriptional regulator, TetR family n=2 Tax=Pseudanabaena TaxID=1152 RepID=L8MXB3_9CYAN|nr:MULTISPECIES: TetR/AcrR family transcriptional regulator [Pseudanabaena]ELS32632.1 transcriptional regulator, TetR family [Pseudanabaena biceps PCC 7429]MDG3495124.1 TetR/AcrR family transcriptional regulator [Pseudanabaena catenata USMAC16]